MRSYQVIPFQFPFKRPGGTSRGVMTRKKSWFLRFFEEGKEAWGECSVIEGLSPDYKNDADYELQILDFCNQWQSRSLDPSQLSNFPSIRFGIETADRHLQTGSALSLFPSDFTEKGKGIPINGLIWMGQPEFMIQQIEEKLGSGFRCIKMKIGAIEWQTEFLILQQLRSRFPADQLEIRVDANGAFQFEEALKVLDQLHDLQVHSIEQPIKSGNTVQMKQLCSETPCPIALDEELIGVNTPEQKQWLLDTIQPQYIIIKPSLTGGFTGMKEWVEIAEKSNIPWWATSALESNIGLNAIAQYTSTFANSLPQGLGTGALYTKNISSPLYIERDELMFDKCGKFDYSLLSQ